jgi:hypothetical protein
VPPVFVEGFTTVVSPASKDALPLVVPPVLPPPPVVPGLLLEQAAKARPATSAPVTIASDLDRFMCGAFPFTR